MYRRRFLGLIAVFSLIFSSLVLSDVSLPAVFSDHMVLQRGPAVPVWGKADPGEKVTVEVAGRKASATADGEGSWKVRMNLPQAGGPFELVVSGKNKVTFKDVLVGEVWVCSGQSNMQWPVQRAMNAKEEIARADYPNLRLFTVKRVVSHRPLSDTEGAWVRCSPQTVPGFSAVAYFFGRDLHKALSVPVGLIHTSWGGTPAEAWTSEETLNAYPEFAPILKRWAEVEARWPEAKKKYEESLKAWREKVKKAKAEGKRPPRRPRPPLNPDHPHWPSGLFNGMIAPIIPYGIKGAIWYQGESNAGRAHQYRALFSAMIRDWRDKWGRGDFPFLFVQLANFMARSAEPQESAWAELREAQTAALALPRTAMAVAIDIGEARNIHPKNKQEVGRRLSLGAQAVAYGRDIVYSGPLYAGMTIEGDRARIFFSHVGGGLTAKGGALKGFAIAGADHKFVWARAEIEGDTVVVRSDKVPEPVAVRYAWADNPECNLYNKEGLPASPFRTDFWPGVTARNQ